MILDLGQGRIDRKIVTVLASLQTRMGNFTLASLLGEVQQWLDNKCSIFEQELHRLQNPNAPPAAVSG